MKTLFKMERGDCGKVNHARTQSTRWFGQVILIELCHCHCCIVLSYQASVSCPDTVPQYTVPTLVTIASVPQRSGAPTKHRQVRRRGSLRKEGREGGNEGNRSPGHRTKKAEEGDQRTVRFYFIGWYQPQLEKKESSYDRSK